MAPDAVVNIGSCLADGGDFVAARPWLERALAIREKKWPDGHPDAVNSLSRLAALEPSAGHASEAAGYATRAAAMAEKVLPKGHPERENMRTLGSARRPRLP